MIFFSGFYNTYGGNLAKCITDSLPQVFEMVDADMVHSRLRDEAIMLSHTHQLPRNRKELDEYKKKLRAKIMEKTGVKSFPELPFEVVETRNIQRQDYMIKNILFQTRPGVFATANLYIPDGTGPFPGVLVVMGHSQNGKLYEAYQSIGHTLALNGYVALNIDPWGAGERGTQHGEFEYHGANLGASLMDVGETLMGMMITDNMRGIDFLISLPYVDENRIGVTGASGGGNQTMWVTALDERVKASMPVVSVGTFESQVMRSNCVGEMLVDGLTFTEAWGVLSLISPRALKISNHKQDSNPTFYPEEMLRSYTRVKSIYQLEGYSENLSYMIVDDIHGYKAEDREGMLGWFDLHLKNKGDGSSKKEIPFQLLPEEDLMIFPPDKKRDKRVLTTAEFCKEKGRELKKELRELQQIDVKHKRIELANILRLHKDDIVEILPYSAVNGWERMVIRTSQGKLIPVLLCQPGKDSENGNYIIMGHPKGKGKIPLNLIQSYLDRGVGIILMDFSGTGEVLSSVSERHDRNLVNMHTLSRAHLWLGKTVLGEWVVELKMVIDYLKDFRNAEYIMMHGTGEAGLAGLFYSDLYDGIEHIELNDIPISFLFDQRETINYYNMGIHLPGILNWGDISLAAALSMSDIKVVDPVSISGRKMNALKLSEIEKEFTYLKELVDSKNEFIIEW